MVVTGLLSMCVSSAAMQNDLFDGGVMLASLVFSIRDAKPLLQISGRILLWVIYKKYI